ncbi:MAG TPA: hypothetical protein VKF80_04395 [Candidatus Eisenbacteria bacterium]|nr:hypothetical protein [Candidatus Eisenbacteria bacterium]
MSTFEYRPDSDPFGERLTGQLSAQMGLEHARRRRIYYAHWTAAAGLFVWIVTLAGDTGRLRTLALITFAAFLVGWLITIAAEIRCWLLLHGTARAKTE